MQTAPSKCKAQEKALPYEVLPSENLMSRRWEWMPLAALSQHLVSESQFINLFQLRGKSF